MANDLKGLMDQGFELVDTVHQPLRAYQQARATPDLERILDSHPETHTVISVADWKVERLDEHPDVFAISGPPGLEVRSARSWRPWHQAVAVVLHDGDQPVVVTDDAALVLQRLAAELQVTALDQDLPFPSAAEVVAAEGAADWLREELLTALGLGPLGHAIAVGHQIRLTDQPMSIADMLAGRPAPPAAAPWLRALRSRHRRSLRALFRAEVVRVGDLVTAAEELDPSTLDGAFVDMLRGRDDLESIREVLWRLGLRDADAELADLDERMRGFLQRQPFDFRLADARLARARRVDPRAWWAARAVTP